MTRVNVYAYSRVTVFTDESGNAEQRDVDIMVSRDTATTSGGGRSCPRAVKL